MKHGASQVIFSLSNVGPFEGGENGVAIISVHFLVGTWLGWGLFEPCMLYLLLPYQMGVAGGAIRTG